VVALRYRGQRCGGAVLQGRHLGGEGPTVIRLAEVVSFDLIGTEFFRVDALVGDGSLCDGCRGADGGSAGIYSIESTD